MLDRLSRSTVLVGFMGLALGGLGMSFISSAIAQNQWIYQCTPNKKIEVQSINGNPSQLQVKLPDGRSLTMSQSQTGSGTKYISGQTIFWSKGNTALVQEGDNVLWRDCVKLP